MNLYTTLYRSRLIAVLTAVLVFFVAVTAADAQKKSDKKKDEKPKDPLSSETLSGLKFRGIGPAITSGRIIDFAVNPNDRSQYYVAVACGGVWKTINAGTSFEPVFDGQKSFSIGCVAMDPTNPYVVWVGTGENNSQRSVSYGDGVYKSMDGGKSWNCMGLKTSEHIGKILIDPRNPNTVYVACQGPLWRSGGERSLYKTTDGGKTWNPVLTISENTGITDVVMDPRDSNVLYAASYQRRRHVWTLINGGPEANIYKSVDGGATWDTLRSGLPSGDKGRIGLAISPVNPDIVYATIEAAEKQGGFYASTDRGMTWEKRNDFVSDAAQYYQELVCDPVDADRVYLLHTILMVTDDGGRNWRALGNRYRHVDDHAMWIDPKNPNYYLVGGDGGVYESFDRAATWRFKENLPVTQFYRVSVDNSEPFYYVYGGTQDNNSLGGPSRTIKSDGGMSEDWFFTNGGDGFKTQIDPKDPNIVYAQSQYGGLVRFDRRSGERIDIQPNPGIGEEPYRWNWDSPLIISPHANTRLYFAANKLFRSDDRGGSWKAVSPDLTRQLDRNQLPVMGKIWNIDAVAKNASTSFYGNIVALAESPKKEGLIYVGTDDGLIQVTEDGGATWRESADFPGVAERTYVSCITASQFDENVVYATFDNHKMADFKPYVLKSVDKGRTWKSIAGDLPDNNAIYVLAEDFVMKDLLFVGGEFGVWCTPNGGQKWIQLKGGLPPAAIRDIVIQQREQDLVLASFGRGFFILDDLTPLRSIASGVLDSAAAIFPVKDALMYIPSGARHKGAQGETFFTAPNPPFGATFTCYLKESIKTRKELRKEAEKDAEKAGNPPAIPTVDALRAEADEEAPCLLFTIRDEDGNVVRTFTAPARSGVQRVSWDLRYGDPSPVREENGPNKSSGMLVMPGSYTVSLAKVVDRVTTPLVGPVRFTVKPLNIATLAAEDKKALAAFQRKVSRLQRAVLGAQRAAGDIARELNYMKGAIESATGATDQMRKDRQALDDRIEAMQRAFNGDRILSERNMNQPPSLVGRLMELSYNLSSATSAPTGAQLEAYRVVAELFPPMLEQLRTINDVELKKLEAQLESIGAPHTPGRIPRWEKE
jgi:photosystem II stability/assembly factor-like uncharacterized protein